MFSISSVLENTSYEPNFTPDLFVVVWKLGYATCLVSNTYFAEMAKV